MTIARQGAYRRVSCRTSRERRERKEAIGTTGASHLYVCVCVCVVAAVCVLDARDGLLGYLSVVESSSLAWTVHRDVEPHQSLMVAFRYCTKKSRCCCWCPPPDSMLDDEEAARAVEEEDMEPVRCRRLPLLLPPPPLLRLA